MSALSASELLGRAAELIEPEGAWTQYIEESLGVNGQRCYCMVGAIHQAAQDSDFDGLNGAYISGRAVTNGSMVFFNDAPNRTQAEVVAKLREAAALAREPGK